MAARKLRVGILGGTGYMGGEAARLIFHHPEAEIAWVSSRQPGLLQDFHPNFYGTGIALSSPDNLPPCDVVFLATPTKASIQAARRFLDSGAKVIDLGSAFRLKDRETWETVYGMEHSDWPLTEEAVYGIPELHGDAISSAKLIANPGCFSSAAIFSLAPLISAGLIDESRLVVCGLSGTAGVGAELSRAAHHPEISGNLVPYNVVGHRHTFEMEQELGALTSRKVTVHFTPVYVPIVRGILSIASVFPRSTIPRSQLLERFREFYSGSPFVKVFDAPKEELAAWQYKPYPWVSAVAGTNFCHIGMDIDEVRGRIVVFGALDSIGKGGAHAGVENMNLMSGLPRVLGLERLGLHP